MRSWNFFLCGFTHDRHACQILWCSEKQDSMANIFFSENSFWIGYWALFICWLISFFNLVGFTEWESPQNGKIIHWWIPSLSDTPCSFFSSLLSDGIPEWIVATRAMTSRNGDDSSSLNQGSTRGDTFSFHAASEPSANEDKSPRQNKNVLQEDAPGNEMREAREEIVQVAHRCSSSPNASKSLHHCSV